MTTDTKETDPLSGGITAEVMALFSGDAPEAAADFLTLLDVTKANDDAAYAIGALAMRWADVQGIDPNVAELATAIDGATEMVERWGAVARIFSKQQPSRICDLAEHFRDRWAQLCEPFAAKGVSNGR
jgi:hypothetical protein